MDNRPWSVDERYYHSFSKQLFRVLNEFDVVRLDSGAIDNSIRLRPGDPGCPPDPEAKPAASFAGICGWTALRAAAENLYQQPVGHTYNTSVSDPHRYICDRCGNGSDIDFRSSSPCGQCGFPELKAVAETQARPVRHKQSSGARTAYRLAGRCTTIGGRIGGILTSLDCLAPDTADSELSAALLNAVAALRLARRELRSQRVRLLAIGTGEG